MDIASYYKFVDEQIVTTGLDNATLIEKVGQIEGSYSLVSASFSQAVDLYGQGKESTDILSQMKAAGKWHGVFDVDGNNPMGRSIVFPVLSVNEEAQANFYDLSKEGWIVWLHRQPSVPARDGTLPGSLCPREPPVHSGS